MGAHPAGTGSRSRGHPIFELTEALGTRVGVRILHVTDIHNRASGLKALGMLADQLIPDLIVDTGDVSGFPGPWQDLFLGIYHRVRGPYVFAPGNHDDARTKRLIRRRGADVLVLPTTVEVAGLRVWGYQDPNRTRWGRGDEYSVDLTRQAAAENRPSVGPVVAAVHSADMVEADDAIGLVLCGHVHAPRIWSRRGTTFMRPGSSGGGGPFGAALRFGVVDVDPVTHKPVAAWFLRIEGKQAAAEKVA